MSDQQAQETNVVEAQPRVDKPKQPGPPAVEGEQPARKAVSRPARIRSRSLAARPMSAERAAAEYIPPLQPAPAAEAAKRPWRWTPLAAALSALLWIVAVSLLVAWNSLLDGRVSSPRLTLAAAWGLAALATFAPLEFRLGLPGLTLQGLLGSTLLGSTLAFVPPPTGWLLELPDLPVYLIFFVALFLAVSAAALPLTFRLGQKLYARRLHQHDLRRARREAYEVGALVVAVMGLAALRVLTLLTGLLLVAVFVLVETLLLSQVAPEK